MPVSSAHLDVTEWDIPRPISICRRLLEAARIQGVEMTECLHGTGLSVADVDNDAMAVHTSQELRLIRNILGLVVEPEALAREVGARYTLANMGILGYAILASPSVGHAIDIACRYAVLSSTFLRLTRHDGIHGTKVEFDNRHVPADVRTFVLERDMHALISMTPLLAGQLDSNALVRLDLPGIPVPVERLRLLRIGIEINSAADRTAMLIPHALLDLPMPAADAITAADCIRQCDDLLRARRRRGVAAGVRARLARTDDALPPMATVAAEMCMSERTLHRRLAAENTTFRRLADEVRAAVALGLLSAGGTVEDSARRLGYSEVAAFTRAFVRWTGESPSAYRRRTSR